MQAEKRTRITVSLADDIDAEVTHASFPLNSHALTVGRPPGLLKIVMRGDSGPPHSPDLNIASVHYTAQATKHRLMKLEADDKLAREGSSESEFLSMGFQFEKSPSAMAEEAQRAASGQFRNHPMQPGVAHPGAGQVGKRRGVS